MRFIVVAAVASLLASACTKSNPAWMLGGGTDASTSGGSTGPDLSTTSPAGTAGTTADASATGSSDATTGGSTGGTDGGSTGDPTDGTSLPDCGQADAWTVALYRFEDLDNDPIADSTGSHSGSMFVGVAAGDPGPPDCAGTAYVGDVGRLGIVPNDPAFELATGAIDLWARPPESGQRNQALLSRDSAGNGPGHISFLLTAVGASEGHLVVRYQDPGINAARCSVEPLVPGEWVHIGVNFGPPGLDLYIDGQIQESDGVAETPGTNAACDPPITGGLGSANDWHIGGSSLTQPENTIEPGNGYYLRGGAVDEIRLSSVRRAF